jgi:hypothetical protein
MIKILNRQSSPKGFKVEQIPYIYQFEYLNNAWGRVHYGYFIDPDGNRYKYKDPKSWFFNTKEDDVKPPYDFKSFENRKRTSDTFEPEELFTNLRSSVKQTGLFSLFKSKLELSDDTLQDLMTSEVKDFGPQGCDMGMKSNILWIYDAATMLYKRILLRAVGDQRFVNQSRVATELFWRYNQ